MNGRPFNKVHRAIPLLHTNEKGEIVSNLSEIEEILTDPAVKDLKVAVVSIAGKFRRGKSFLLNFFLRYLYANDINKQGDDWFGSDDEELEGFAWAIQTEGLTTGILIWSKVFIIEAENEKIAVILMDTQGIFDHAHVMEEHTKIFAMTTLLSSFEIYNVMRDIEEDDLQNLAVFTTYAEKFHQRSDIKMGQKLHFLVRDWSCLHEFPFGSEGGRQNLAKKLDISNRKPEFSRVREALRSSYEEMSCYLMPYPGTKIIMDPNSKGKNSAMDQVFVEHLKKYVPYVFSEENIKPKTLNGRPIKVSDLIYLIQNYATLFAEGEKNGVKIMDIFEMYTHASFELAKDQGFELYKTKMVSDYKIYETIGSFNAHHEISKKAATNLFCETVISGSNDIKQKYAVNLDKEMELLYRNLKREMFEMNFSEWVGETIGKAAGVPIGAITGAVGIDMVMGGAGVIGVAAIGFAGAVIGVIVVGSMTYKIVRKMSLKDRFVKMKLEFLTNKFFFFKNCETKCE